MDDKVAEFEYAVFTDTFHRGLRVPAEDAEHVLWDDHPDFDEREDNHEGKRRWCEERSKVVKHTPSGKYYRFGYERGLTECQDDHPTFDSDVVLFVEVSLMEVVTREWEPVPRDG